MHVLDSLTETLQTLDIELKMADECCTERIVKLENVLASLQITNDSKHTDSDRKYSETEQ